MSTTIEEELQKEQDLESHQDENGKVKLPKKADRKKVVIVSLVSIFFLFIVLTSIISPGGSKKKVSNEQSTKSNITLLEDSLNLLKNRQNDIMITEPQISNLAGLEEMKMSQNKILNEQLEIMSRLQKLENLRNESLNENRGPVLDKYAMRFEQTNQQLNNFVKGNVGRAWRMSDEDLNEMNSSSHLKNVNNELLNLQENTLSMIGGEGSKIIFPAGTRMEMITESDINSDYPGYVTAKIATPYQLKGWKAILKHNGQVNNRISASIEKVVNAAASREYTVSGQVEMNFPGLVGKVKNHWAKRVIPELVATTIGAGYVAYEVQRQIAEPRDSSGLRIDSRDAYAGAVAQQTVSSAQGEARRFGGDVPNTVTVPRGERFWFLLTQPLSVEL